MGQLHQDFNRMSLDQKIEFSKGILKKAFEENNRIAVAITGGKDSTVTLWLVKKVCEDLSIPLPDCIFIDEGDEFDEIVDFVQKLSGEWELNVHWLRNQDVLDNLTYGNLVFVQKLNKENRDFLQEIGFKEPYFLFETESFIGTQLMKIYPLKKFLIENHIQALITGVRWDEQEARSNENFFSSRKDPEHIRVHPILHMKERDIWDTIHKYNVPYCSLYELGYRSIGAKSSTKKVASVPAWEQDLENTSERAGRLQEKEKIMASLRQLGYM